MKEIDGIKCPDTPKEFAKMNGASKLQFLKKVFDEDISAINLSIEDEATIIEVMNDEPKQLAGVMQVLLKQMTSSD